MKKKSVLILDKERITHKLRRMAYEIWERNSDEEEIILVGIENGGKILAYNLDKLIREISPLKIKCFSLNINKKNPLNYVLDFNENLSGQTVILVDDVINSGKTIAYALHALLFYDIKKLMTAVLVDRKHKSFPVASDIVGHTVATTMQDHIEVETKDNEITAVYLD